MKTTIEINYINGRPDKWNWNSTVNSAKLYAGWFQGSPLQILSRFTWELPQTLLGHEFSQVANLFNRVSSVEYWGGSTVVKNG